jgi:hypothetical protein
MTFRITAAAIGLSAFLALPLPAVAQTNTSETYRLINLFGEVLDRVRTDYVESVEERKLIEDAINGMLSALDPHSSFMGAKSFRDMQVHLHLRCGSMVGPEPASDFTSLIHMMGGWPSNGWLESSLDPFTSTEFDQHNAGFTGTTLALYRSSGTEQYHPRAQQEWLGDIIDFDYPQWHTTADAPDACSAESLDAVGRVMLAWLREQR